MCQILEESFFSHYFMGMGDRDGVTEVPGV
jgi:hypothetical protein